MYVGKKKKKVDCTGRLAKLTREKLHLCYFPRRPHFPIIQIKIILKLRFEGREITL